MKIGINLPNLGTAAGPDGVVKVAEKAESLGFDSLWSTERLLWPIEPRTGYSGIEGLALPDAYKVQLDPLDVLTYAAAVTKTARLGTSVLDLPYYNPVMLARRVTTLDVLSGGRAMLGLGQGWSSDEFEATGASMKDRGPRADEAIKLMHTIWQEDPAGFDGKYFKLAKSIIQPKPVQKPGPPIYLAAFAPSAMKRVATLADGWLPVAVPVEGMRQMWAGIKQMAAEAGRNPDDLKLIVRANIAVLPEAQGEGRYIFAGSETEVRSDIEATKELGADEIEFDPTLGPWGATVDGFLECAERVREWVG